MGKKIVLAGEPVGLFCEGSAENTGRSASKGRCRFRSTSDRVFCRSAKPRKAAVLQAERTCAAGWFWCEMVMKCLRSLSVT